MEDSLVTLATFRDPVYAYLARSKLESEGIDAVVFDDNVVSVNWLYSNAVGGVKLKVKESEADRAAAILNEDVSEEALPAEESAAPAQSSDLPRCPRCASDNVSYERFSRRLVFLSWLLLGFPLPFLRKRWTCSNCGHRWKAS